MFITKRMRLCIQMNFWRTKLYINSILAVFLILIISKNFNKYKNSIQINSNKILINDSTAAKTTIFCFILTYPKHFETFTKVSYENCFKHCTDYRFVTVYDKKVEGLPYKFLHPNNWPKESYKLITNKIFNGFIQTSTFPAYDWYPN